MTRSDSMWFCPKCRIWVGYERESCGEGHSCPRFPLRWLDVEKQARDVTRFDQWRGKLKSVVNQFGGCS